MVRVDPIDIGKRAFDESVASFCFEFSRFFKARCDLSTLSVVQYDPATGVIIDHKRNAEARDWYMRAIAIDPDLAEARAALRRLSR